MPTVDKLRDDIQVLFEKLVNDRLKELGLDQLKPNLTTGLRDLCFKAFEAGLKAASSSDDGGYLQVRVLFDDWWAVNKLTDIRLKAKDMIPGKWYRAVPNTLGRFMCGGFTQGKVGVMVFVDADQDMRSCRILKPDQEVEEDEPKV